MEEKGTDVAELLGRHRYQLDAKGRIALPVRFRAAFAEGLVLTLGTDGCLWGFTREEWELRKREARSGIGQAGRHTERLFFSNAEPAELDRQGRLTIPQRLRDRVDMGREVELIGVDSRIEIWDVERWEAYERQHLAEYLEGAATQGP